MSKASKTKILSFALIALVCLGLGAQNWKQTSAESSEAALNAHAHAHAEELAKRIQNLDLPEYVGLKLDPEAKTADVWLSAKRSSELLDVIKDSNGFKVTLHDSPFSAAQLDEAVAKINLLVSSSKVPESVVLSSSAKREDGSGIDLTIDKASKVPDAKWVKSFGDYLGAPVFVDPVKTNISLGSTRVEDSAPWRGGSLFASKDASGKTLYCSSGFGVVSKLTKIQYMLTARHCFKNQNQTLRTLDTRSKMGFWMLKSYYNSVSNDVSLTIPSQSVVRNSVYYGNFITSKAKQVVAVGTNTVGLRVCTNGANSGLHCNVVIRKGPHQVYFGNVVYQNVVTGSKDNNQIVVAQGDSGGPVVSQADSSGTLQGFGIIHSLSIIGRCADYGVQINVGPSSCGRNVYWIDLKAALSDLRVTLK